MSPRTQEPYPASPIEPDESAKPKPSYEGGTYRQEDLPEAGVGPAEYGLAGLALAMIIVGSVIVRRVRG